MSVVFFQSFSILVREGLEALLVIAALAAYQRKVGAAHRLQALYVGALAAVAASLLAAWAFARFNDGVHHDMVEGVTILIAALLMLYVSGWLFMRQDPHAWQSYLNAKASEALAKETNWAVAALAFLAVFREGAETVLFIHALARTEGGWGAGLIGGLISGAGVLFVIFAAINILAQRIPLRPLFLVTSAFLFVSAIKFIGDAMQEFQEQQYVPYNEFHGSPVLAAIGFNPTVEAVAVQIGVVLAALMTFVVLSRRTRAAQSRKEAAKSAA